MFYRANVPSMDALRDDLAASTGAGLVGFSHSASYATSTVGKKLQQFVNPMDAPYSATGDGTANDYTAFAAADAAAAAAGIPLFITKTHRLNTSYAPTANLVFFGGKIKPASGTTFTIGTALIAACVKIFDLSLGGTVLFSDAKLEGLGLNVFWFGAVGDDSTNDLAAFNATLAACKASGVAMFIPGGYAYSLDGGGASIDWNPTLTRDGALRAIPIIGGGAAHTVLHVSNSGTRGIYVFSSAAWFDLTIEGVTIKGSVAGALLTIGKDDYSDPVNMMSIEGVSVENSLNNASNEAVRFNYIAGGDVINLRANSYADGLGTNVGSALRIRQAEFVTFVGGAAGNAARGVDITDGVNFGLTFIGQTYENTNYCWSHRSANSGGHSVLGGQFSNVVTYPIFSSGMLGGQNAEFIGCNFQPAGDVVDPANYVGIHVHDSRGITPPAVPASTVAATNTTGRSVMVFINGGNVTGITVNGSSVTYATNSYVFLKAGGTLAITYSVAPTWSWETIG